MSNRYSNKLINRDCILCGSADLSQVSTKMRNGPQLITSICKQCSLIYTNPIPTSDVYYSFYTNDYEKYYGKSTASKPHAIQEPLIFSSIKNFIDINHSDYLEIGPGRGLTLYHANKLFRSAKGIEPSIDFTNLLTKTYGLKVENNTFENFMASPRDKVDVVSMFHVLEHIYDPYKGLMDIRNILREDGLVVIEVPNILKPFRNLDTYFLRFVHLYNFSPLTLRGLLEKCGFNILYEDDGGDDWSSPQNILVIARKAELRKISLDHLRNEADEVLSALQRYREFYSTSLKFKWFLFDSTRTPIKYYRKVKYKVILILMNLFRTTRIARINKT